MPKYKCVKACIMKLPGDKGPIYKHIDVGKIIKADENPRKDAEEKCFVELRDEGVDLVIPKKTQLATYDTGPTSDLIGKWKGHTKAEIVDHINTLVADDDQYPDHRAKTKPQWLEVLAALESDE